MESIGFILTVSIDLKRIIAPSILIRATNNGRLRYDDRCHYILKLVNTDQVGLDAKILTRTERVISHR